MAIAAGSGIDLPSIGGQAEKGVGDLAPAAAAPVGLRAQRLQGLFVEGGAQALENDGPIPI